MAREIVMQTVQNPQHNNNRMAGVLHIHFSNASIVECYSGNGLRTEKKNSLQYHER